MENQTTFMDEKITYHKQVNYAQILHSPLYLVVQIKLDTLIKKCTWKNKRPRTATILKTKNKEQQQAYQILKVFINLLYLRECGSSTRGKINKTEKEQTEVEKQTQAYL